MIKAVVFDCFNVLIDDPQAAWLKMHGFEREGAFAEASEKLDAGHIDLKQYHQRYADGHGAKTVEEVETEFKELAKLDPNVADIVSRLRNAEYLTGLLSNTSTEEIDPLLEEYALKPIFDEVIISSEVGMVKPDARIFKLMLDKLGVEPDEALFVDDSPTNVKGAFDVGMNGILHIHTDAENLERSLIEAGVKLPVAA